MEPQRIILVSIILFISLWSSNGDIVNRFGSFKTSCFGTNDTNDCHNSRVKICQDYYGCDLMIEFSSPIKRIAYTEGEILVAEGHHTYCVDEHDQTVSIVKKAISPKNEFVDKKGNKYYAGEGTTYVSDKETGNEIEIVTTGDYSFNQLALDTEANRLFILSFTSSSKSEARTGKLYAMIVDPLPIVDDKIFAEYVEVQDNITALAVEGGLNKLLLGIKTETGSKLIRVTRQPTDYCVKETTPKDEILKIVNEAGERVINVFEQSNLLNVRMAEFHSNDLSGYEVLKAENEKLKQELQSSKVKLNVFTSKLSYFNSNLKATSLDTPPNEHESSTAAPIHSGDYESRTECLPSEDVQFLKSRVTYLQEQEKDLKKRIIKITHVLDDFVKDTKIERPVYRSLGRSMDSLFKWNL